MEISSLNEIHPPPRPNAPTERTGNEPTSPLILSSPSCFSRRSRWRENRWRTERKGEKKKLAAVSFEKKRRAEDHRSDRVYAEPPFKGCLVIRILIARTWRFLERRYQRSRSWVVVKFPPVGWWSSKRARPLLYHANTDHFRLLLRSLIQARSKRYTRLAASLRPFPVCPLAPLHRVA